MNFSRRGFTERFWHGDGDSNTSPHRKTWAKNNVDDATRALLAEDER